MGLNKKRLKRVTKPELKPRDLDILLLKSRPMPKIDNWNRRSLTNSTPVEFSLAFPPVQDNLAVAMATSSREKNLSSTRRRWRRRRVSEQHLNQLVHSIKKSH